MPVDKDIEGDQVVDCLGSAIYHGESELSNVPGLLKRVLEEGFWRRRVMRLTGQIVEFERFLDFVKEKPPEGLGTNLKTLQRLCAGSAEVLDLLDRETVAVPGAPKGNRNAAKEKTTGLNQSVSSKRDRTQGNLRRLRKDFPALHQCVLDGSKTVTEAAIEAGIYPRRISINIASASSAADSIVQHCSGDFIESLISLLQNR